MKAVIEDMGPGATFAQIDMVFNARRERQAAAIVEAPPPADWPAPRPPSEGYR